MAKKSPAKLLKDKGLIPKHWDLRKPLSAGQKSWITKQSKTYAQLIRRPGDFSIKRVSDATAKSLKESGYKTTGNRAVIPAKNAKVRIVKGAVEIIRPHQTERVILAPGPDFLKRVEKLYAKKLKPNQAWALKIGNSPTMNSIYPDLRQLMGYVSNMRMHSKNGENHMSMVLITVNGPGLINRPDADEDDSDEYDSEE